MTEDQIREIANLSASMAHVTKAVDDIKTRVDKMPTREELREFVTHQELTSLAGRLHRWQHGPESEGPRCHKLNPSG
jgi:hypothetical protein